MIRLDFETRSKADLERVGSWKYSLDPSTEILCLAAKRNDEKTKLYDRLDLSLGLNWDFFRNEMFEAHNVGFESAIWENIMVVRYGMPKIHSVQWTCSAAKAASLSLPRKLEEAVKAMGLPIEKDMEGHNLMLKMCKPRKPTKNNPAVWHETEKDLQRLYEYCIQDVEAEYALSKAMERYL